MKKLIHENPITVKTAELYRSRILLELQEEMNETTEFTHYWHMLLATEKWLKNEATIDWLHQNRKKSIIEIAHSLYMDDML